MVAICEDLPEAHNRVTLDPVLKDAHGIPAPKVDYTLSENTNRMLDHAIARATEALRETRQTRIIWEDLIMLQRQPARRGYRTKTNAEFVTRSARLASAQATRVFFFP